MMYGEFVVSNGCELFLSSEFQIGVNLVLSRNYTAKPKLTKPK